MAINRNKRNVGYGITNGLQDLAPQPIVAQRDPATTDKAELGTVWVNKSSNGTWMLTSVDGTATWTGLGSTGGPFADLTITGAAAQDVFTIDEGNAVITAGDLTLTNGNAVIGGNLDVTGDVTITGDFDITDTAAISITSTANSADAIYLHANGGTSETIRVHSDQGTGVASVALVSDVGGITLTSGLASADAINLAASAGGVDIDGALQVNIASSQNAADAIVINASAGGIDITNTGTAGEDIDIASSGASVNISATENAANAITLTSNGGTSETIVVTNSQGTSAASINVVSTAGGVTLSGGLATADAINIVSSAAGGGIDIDGGTAGIAVDTTGAFSIDGAAASNVTVTGAGIDLTLASVLGSVLVSSTEDAALAIMLHANGGTSETIRVRSDQGTGAASLDLLSDVGGITLTAGLGSADAINLVTSNAGGGIDVDAGTAGFIVDTTGAFSIDGAAASNVTTTGAGIDLTLSSVLGSVLVSSTEDAALAIRLHANGGTSETIQVHSDQGTGVDSVGLLSDVGGITVRATGLASADAINLEAAAGGIDVDAALQINIASSQNAADAIVINASAGGIDITNTGTAGEDIDIASSGASVNISATENAASAITLTSNGGTSETIVVTNTQGTGAAAIALTSSAGGITLTSNLATADGINLVATGGGIDVDAALQINVRSTQSAADSIVVESTAGGIDILASGAAAGEDIDIIATGSSVNVTATEATADAIVLNASNAAGGIDLLTGGGEITISSAGNVTMVPGTASVAGTSLTLNARVGVATFTGQTTASAGTITLTITNSALGAGDGIFCTVSNKGSNDAQMTLTRVNTETAGTLIVQADNNGAAALNGDIIVTFWIIN